MTHLKNSPLIAGKARSLRDTIWFPSRSSNITITKLSARGAATFLSFAAMPASIDLQYNTMALHLSHHSQTLHGTQRHSTTRVGTEPILNPGSVDCEKGEDDYGEQKRPNKIVYHLSLSTNVFFQ
jgi:hypothetical protein